MIKILKGLFIFLGAIFLIFSFLLLVAFITVKDLRIKEIVEDEIEHSLGIKVTIDKLDFSPLLAHIQANGITIHNPAGFSEGELAYIEYLHFVFDPLEVAFRKKPNIYLLAMDLKRLNIVKNKEGRVNIKEITPIKGRGSLPDDTPFYFDVVVLSVGEVTYIDHSVRGEKMHRYHIGIKDATFLGLKNEEEVVKQIVYKAIQNTDIGKMINLTIVPVVSQISDTLNAALGTARTGAKGAWEIATLPLRFIFGQ